MLKLLLELTYFCLYLNKVSLGSIAGLYYGASFITLIEIIFRIANFIKSKFVQQLERLKHNSNINLQYLP